MKKSAEKLKGVKLNSKTIAGYYQIFKKKKNSVQKISV